MANYEKYKQALGISNNQIIEVISQQYSGFSKIQCSMINNPEKYGVCLTEEAEKILCAKFGYAGGLNIKKRFISRISAIGKDKRVKNK